jgi:hypothetical protein
MPFRTIRDLGDEITPDYFVAIDETNKMAVIDTEGDVVFFVPASLLELEESMADPILLDIGNIVGAAMRRGFMNGEIYGRGAVRTEIHKLLGIDRLTAAVDRIADQALKI